MRSSPTIKISLGSAVSGDQPVRLRLSVSGIVQGVGFRPFVFRLAGLCGLTGRVRNTRVGAVIELEGPVSRLSQFQSRLVQEHPAGCLIQTMEVTWLDPLGYRGFVVEKSEEIGGERGWVRPDVATCPECLGELFDPDNRRYRYPFTNCTFCGPRYSIIESLPYDRPNTTMRRFPLCEQCAVEYADPENRRFHAQPNACPHCGPQLDLWDGGGLSLSSGDAALRETVKRLQSGEVVAVKGLGGFHLMVDAGNAEAVQHLRDRKHREEKPFAVMFPSLAGVRGACSVSDDEAKLLVSSEAPIVLLDRLRSAALESAAGRVCPQVAPGNPCLGVLLPYTPLHHLLLRDLGTPVVATSGNRADEPICIDEHEAKERLRGIADAFLVHNRPIVRPVDDSIVRVIAGREMVLRRARGFAPLPILLGTLPKPEPDGATPEVLPGREQGRAAAPVKPADSPLLAVGAHLKNTVALGVSDYAFLSQHLGDLDTPQARDGFRRAIADLSQLFAAKPERVITDLHPDYASTRYAAESAWPCQAVQHHYAHVLACMAENDLQGEILGICWDGTGYGPDGTIWGGEFLIADEFGYRRFARLRPFPLPGGEKAIREPRRTAAGLLYEAYGAERITQGDDPSLQDWDARERATLCRMLEQRINCPRTSSIGRLFDGVSSLLGIRQRCRFEGQAAMELEWSISPEPEVKAYPFPYHLGARPVAMVGVTPAETTARHAAEWELDWRPLLEALLTDRATGSATGALAGRFQESLVEAILVAAQQSGLRRVVLTGGCFQNRALLERTVARLRHEEFRPYWHQRVPTNDGGIALGQIMAGRFGGGVNGGATAAETSGGTR